MAILFEYFSLILDKLKEKLKMQLKAVSSYYNMEINTIKLKFLIIGNFRNPVVFVCCYVCRR